MADSTQLVPILRRRAQGPQSRGRWRAWVPTASRVISAAAVIFFLGMLPWLSNRDPAVSIFRARYSEADMTPAALEAVRQQLGLHSGPFGVFFTWLGKALTGDWGVSWVSQQPVLPTVLRALGVSLSLMVFSLIVATVVAAALSITTFRRGLAGRSDRTGGGLAAAFTSMPEFLLASLLLVVFAVGLRWFPPYGWANLSDAVLPALSMGLPAGGYMGRLFSDAVASTFSEHWVATWSVAGFSKTRLVTAVIRRSLPGITPQIGLVFVGLTAAAVAVEQVFAIPGIGRTTLSAAQSQDLPMLQAGVIFLMFLAMFLGVSAGIVRRVLLGPALRTHALPTSVPKPPSPRRAWILPIASLSVIMILVLLGLPRDPYAVVWPRLAAPSWPIPLGADESGRDLLARISHGALDTVFVAIAVSILCFVLGIVIGMFPNAAAGLIEVKNALPPVIAGLIIAGILGPSAIGAALAITLAGWAPLAAHTAALVAEVRAQPYVQVAPMLGVGRARLMIRYVLPGVVGPVFRHAALRLPGIALALAALGFLGLGPRPPAPDWGLILAEGMPYIERAPLVVFVPAGALVLLSVFAVSLSSLTVDFRSGRGGIRRMRLRSSKNRGPRNTGPTPVVRSFEEIK
ncbi:ABC transporter permease subunit [Sinomonas sp. JGH33]|uniref:ABC transporter permease subunit n=1 Tax=Sinomonas terricola TaxID=3110330 RepID=A0ABU5T613_9MICC|nr:ABC transporter permease subunit [Sinomonas sp. JGH33]MEA5455118.1 ABC transporter permease subunit [Sinomonas sp. JGH33]